MTCQNCKNPIGDNSTKCEWCGSEIQKINFNEPNSFISATNETYKIRNIKENKKIIIIFFLFSFILAGLYFYKNTEPTSAEEIYNLGVISSNENNFEEAERYYIRALEINPNFYEANLNLAILKLKFEDVIISEMNNLGTSVNDNNRFVELNSQRKKIFKEALPYLEKAFEAKPDNLDVKKTLLNIYNNLEMKNEYNNLNQN